MEIPLSVLCFLVFKVSESLFFPIVCIVHSFKIYMINGKCPSDFDFGILTKENSSLITWIPSYFRLPTLGEQDPVNIWTSAHTRLIPLIHTDNLEVKTS